MKTNVVRKYLSLVNILLALLGLAITAYGGSKKDDDQRVLLIGVGGALLGSGVASLISMISGSDVLEDVRAMLREMLQPGFVSHMDDLKKFPYKRLYHYYVSQLNGNPIWRLGIIEISGQAVAGRLTAEADYPDMAGHARIYAVTVGVVDNRVILVVKDGLSSESADICVFPYRTGVQVGCECGVGCLETLDRAAVVAPQILSHLPIGKCSAAGTISDPEDVVSLNKQWAVGFNGISTLYVSSGAGTFAKVPLI